MLEQLDQQLFIYLNSQYSPFWDNVMYIISMKLVWIPLYLGIVLWLGSQYGRKTIVIILFVIIAVTVTDQVSGFIKESVDRLRPCHDPSLNSIVHQVKDVCGGQFGFVSSHAANSFNFAVMSLMLIRRQWFSVSIIVWAIFVSYSRIYLGVHYPGDVICGSVLGALTGYGMCRLYELTDKRFLQDKSFFYSESRQ